MFEMKFTHLTIQEDRSFLSDINALLIKNERLSESFISLTFSMSQKPALNLWDYMEKVLLTIHLIIDENHYYKYQIDILL